MKYFKIILYVGLLFFLAKYTLYMATDYQTQGGRMHLPFVLWVIDTIDLFIHEAGHVIFALFGRMSHFLGGTVLQIILPLATVIVVARSSLHLLPFSLYWTGHSMINVSVYIGDAPYRRLQLLSPSAIHDWHWIFTQLHLMEEAETIASIVNILGILICSGGVLIGFVLVFFDVRSIFYTRKGGSRIFTSWDE